MCEANKRLCETELLLVCDNLEENVMVKFISPHSKLNAFHKLELFYQKK